MERLLCVENSTVNGNYSPPPSKSWTHRALTIAALTEGTTTIENPLDSDDTLSTLHAIEALGAVVENEHSWKVKGCTLKAGKRIDAGNSGTTLRFMMGASALVEGETELVGDSSLDKRPVCDLADALRQAGARVNVFFSNEEHRRIIKVRGPIHGGKIAIGRLESSQTISALLMALPLVKENSTITVEETLSKPYMKMTIALVEKAGGNIKHSADLTRFDIMGNSKYSPTKFVIPPDYSSLAYPVCACALAGGRVVVDNIERGTMQADEALLDILPKTGAMLDLKDRRLIVEGPAKLHAFSVEVRNFPDLFPPLCALAAFAEGTSRLFGAPHLAHKESDRIKTMKGVLDSVGIVTRKLHDGLEILGKQALGGSVADAAGDHRIVMAAFILGLGLKNGLKIKNADCVSVSYPHFLDDMRALGVKYHYCDAH